MLHSLLRALGQERVSWALNELGIPPTAYVARSAAKVASAAENEVYKLIQTVHLILNESSLQCLNLVSG